MEVRMRLAGKVALVTGGGSGIGQATAELFAAEGARVVVADRNLGGARTTVEHITSAGGDARAIEADVSVEDSVADMVARAIDGYGRIDILVNNAALARGDNLLEIDLATWELNLQVTLRSVFLCSKAVLPGMIARRSGAIVNISSVNGLAGYGEEAYSAAKAGVINMTKNMALTYGPSGVRTNCICPGTIRTPVWQPFLEQNPGHLDRIARWYPLGRVGEPTDIAKAALFLASDDASWITGSTLVVDGGLTAGNYRMAQELMGTAD
jgi:NAD(P)-dependent dehydrogenase (short-subunit alcohol dehydrogenase family)